MIDKEKAIEEQFRGCLGELILHIERKQPDGNAVVDISSLHIDLLRQFFGSGFEWGILYGQAAALCVSPDR
jgi:hypothetical protein